MRTSRPLRNLISLTAAGLAGSTMATMNVREFPPLRYVVRASMEAAPQ
jgi:hypothetical protein